MIKLSHRGISQMKKIVIISTSLRKGSNSEVLASEVERGAKEAGHEVEFISLKDKEIKFCKGCLACQKTGRCVINDDVNDILDKVMKADVIVWATPVYYYEMSGQMKTLIDRLNALYELDYKFREVYLITTSADNSEGVIDTVLSGLKGWLACLDKAKLCGYLDGGGVNDSGEVWNNAALTEQAYNMGKNI